jgi:hypothetical protein
MLSFNLVLINLSSRFSGEELESHFRHHEGRSMIFDSELSEMLFQNSQQG